MMAVHVSLIERAGIEVGLQDWHGDHVPAVGDYLDAAVVGEPNRRIPMVVAARTWTAGGRTVLLHLDRLQ